MSRSATVCKLISTRPARSKRPTQWRLSGLPGVCAAAPAWNPKCPKSSHSIRWKMKPAPEFSAPSIALAARPSTYSGMPPPNCAACKPSGPFAKNCRCPLAALPVHKVFIGSCTNARLSDLQSAASIVAGHRVASGVQALVVPGSSEIKKQAEQLGLDRIFREAGFEWRESGCSMCVGMNADRVERGQRCVSTSNRNFEGRQGPGARTHLASPATAAASAIVGAIADCREFVSA